MSKTTLNKKYLILGKYRDLNADNFRYICKDTGYLIKYKDIRDKFRKDLYIKSPNLKFGFSESCSDFVYLTFYFDNEDKTTETFKNLMRLIDKTHIHSIYEYDTIPPPDKLVSSYERNYIPSINSKWNDLSKEQDSLKIRINRKDLENLEVYDQDNIKISVDMLGDGNNCRLLLQNQEIIKTKIDSTTNYYKPIWNIIQIKTQMPEKVFTTCQFDDDDINAKNIEDLDDKLIWDIYEDYGY